MPPPKCKAFLLCEKTIVEQGTGRISLINVFSKVKLDSYPGSLPRFRVFLQFSGGIGRQDLVLRVHDLQEDRFYGESQPIALNWTSRLANFNVLLTFPSVQIDHPGAYDMVLFVGGEEIERQRFAMQEDNA